MKDLQTRLTAAALIRILDDAARHCRDNFNCETLADLRLALATYRQVVPAEDTDPAFDPDWRPPPVLRQNIAEAA